MIDSLFLAQFWGWLLVLTGATLLFRSDAFLKDLSRLVSEDKGFAVTTGYLALLVGLASVLLYRTWSADVMVLVTIFGWLSLVKGIIRLAFPRLTKAMASWAVKQGAFLKILLVLVVFLGLWLLVAAR